MAPARRRAPMSLPRLGAWWMVVAGLLFAGMGVFVKLGGTHYLRRGNGLLPIAVRCAGGLRAARARGLVPVHAALAGACAAQPRRAGGMLLLFYVIGMLPLATATTLNYTSPLFLVVLSVLVFKERPRPWLVVVRGCSASPASSCCCVPTFAANQIVAGLLGLASGLCAAIAYLTTGQLGRLGEPAWRIVLYFTLVSTVGRPARSPWSSAASIRFGFDGARSCSGWARVRTLGQLAMTQRLPGRRHADRGQPGLQHRGLHDAARHPHLERRSAASKLARDGPHHRERHPGRQSDSPQRARRAL